MPSKMERSSQAEEPPRRSLQRGCENTLLKWVDGNSWLSRRLEAMEAVPTTLAENAGLDPIDILVELRSKHEKAVNPWFGVDVYSGEIKDMKKLNVLEPVRVKQQVVKSASEAASMILRIDDVIASKSVEKGGPGGGKDFPKPGGDDEYYGET